jgi:hypothetical protein
MQNNTTTKPLNQNKMKLNQNDRREEVAAYTTMILIGVVSILLIIHFITT